MATDLELCMEQAAPLLPDFSEAWQLAMEAYRGYPPGYSAEHDDTTAANCIRSHMWMEMERRFRDRPGCSPLTLRGLRVLNFSDQIVWRFKRVDGGGRHRNYQTKQQRDFDNQKPLPGIPPPAVRLTSGYQPDASGQAIERIIVARPLGRTTQWAAQVNIVDKVPTWIEITPKRFAGTERFQRKPGTGEV